MICLLFDLDGTLVLTGGAGMRAFDKAYKKVFHLEGDISGVSPAGKTDRAILLEVCRMIANREPTPEEEEEVFRQYLGYLREEIKASTKFRILPGVKPLLEALSRNRQCLLGLGTGNLKEGARIKLIHAGFWQYFTFGGFGCDATDRTQLLTTALQRGTGMLPDDEAFEAVYVIGDTPLDVHAGKAIGARTLGVATGPYSLADLEAAGADYLYPDLSDNEAVLSDLGL